MKKIINLILLLVILQAAFFRNSYAESFTWPSDGYIVWKYYTNTNYQEGIDGTYHTGIDIWSNSDGLWNNHVTGISNPVYSAYAGQVVYVDSMGIVVKHNNSLYTKYWHLLNRQVSNGDNVDTNTLMGYQDMAHTVHIHVTVASSSVGYDTDYTLDPSSYFGVQLYEGHAGAVTPLYQVSRIACGGSNTIISNQNINGPKDCGTNEIITINPNTIINSNSGTTTLHVP